MAVIVFDNDDTLTLGTAAIYSKAQALFFLYMYEIFGPQMVSYSALHNIHQQHESEAVKTWSVKRGRVAYSMLKTYWKIYDWASKRFGINFSEEEHVKHGVQINKFGDLPFDHSQVQWFPETIELLEKLDQAGHKLCLLTNYDPDEWLARAAKLRVDHFFDVRRTLAVLQKKIKEDFIKVSGWNEKDDKRNLWIAVGNAEIDVIPPIEISPRWHGIHIPYGSNSSIHSAQKEVDLNPVIHYPRVINIPSLKELESAINQLIKSAS